MDENEWVEDYIFSKHKRGVTLRELLRKAKMWGFDLQYVKDTVSEMFVLSIFTKTGVSFFQRRMSLRGELIKLCMPRII